MKGVLGEEVGRYLMRYAGRGVERIQYVEVKFR